MFEGICLYDGADFHVTLRDGAVRETVRLHQEAPTQWCRQPNMLWLRSPSVLQAGRRRYSLSDGQQRAPDTSRPGTLTTMRKPKLLPRILNVAMA